MAEDWATEAAKKAAEQDHRRQLNLETNAREAEIKNNVGAELFKQLREWIDSQVKQFNSLRGHEELVVTPTMRPSSGSQKQFDEMIRLNRSNGAPVTITYHPIPHTITCQGGAGPQLDFVLTIAGATAVFQNTYQQNKSPEEMGAAMLDKLINLPS